MRLKSLQELKKYRNLFEAPGKQEQDSSSQVIVMRHAVERLRDWRRCAGADSLSDLAAERALVQIARNGTVVGRRPGGAVEVGYNGLYAVVKRETNKTVVLTFNGDREWRSWFRRNHGMLRRTRKVLAAL